MEDAATAEICRAQIWQWMHHKRHLDSGKLVDIELIRQKMESELKAMEKQSAYPISKLKIAATLFEDTVMAEEFSEFLTLPAYSVLEN